jgi:dCMP deaminase
MKQKWVRMYLDIALRISKESYAERLKVGAVFVSKEGVMSIGINGLPAGHSNICETKLEDGSLKTLDCVSHAEENLFGKLMRQGVSTKDGSIFLTHSPCIHCAKIMVNASIQEVYYINQYRITDGIDWLKTNGIHVEQVAENSILDRSFAFQEGVYAAKIGMPEDFCHYGEEGSWDEKHSRQEWFSGYFSV